MNDLTHISMTLRALMACLVPVFIISKKKIMSVIKVIEVLSESSVSWEDAARQAVAKASKTIHNIRSVYIKDHSARVEKGNIISYRINAKISFTLD